MKATDILEEEHKHIKQVINALKMAVKKLENGEEVDPDLLEKAIDFIKNFADKCHHAKEEDILFKILQETGMPKEGGPISMMLSEHEKGRKFVKALSEATERYENKDASAKQDIIKNGLGYANLLTLHIEKEDSVLYPMANHLLTEAKQEQLLKDFEEVEEKLGHDFHHRYLKIAKELEKELNI